jgi:23S rRNA pseudouridine1911/1915/1917 synthase
MKFNIIYEDESFLVINKPAGVNADSIPKRVHRLDKDTSGILLVAKNDKTLAFFQRQFQEKKVKKKYLALVTGNLKNKEGEIKNLLGRSPKDRRKQKVYLPYEPEAEGKREAATKYKLLKRFEDYDLIEVELLTGRKHQIRAQFAHLGHPIAGDKLYGFKNRPVPEGLSRQFLHSFYLKIELPNGKTKEFNIELPEELKEILKKLPIK